MVLAHMPCLQAFMLTALFPRSDFGPVDRLAFLRLMALRSSGDSFIAVRLPVGLVWCRRAEAGPPFDTIVNRTAIVLGSWIGDRSSSRGASGKEDCADEEGVSWRRRGAGPLPERGRSSVSGVRRHAPVVTGVEALELGDLQPDRGRQRTTPEESFSAYSHPQANRCRTGRTGVEPAVTQRLSSSLLQPAGGSSRDFRSPDCPWWAAALHATPPY